MRTTLNNISVNNGLGTVPTPAYLQGNLTTSLGPRLTIGGVAQSDALGNAMYANEAFDPATQQTVNGQVVRKPFPNDTIPVTRFDPGHRENPGLTTGAYQPEPAGQ